MLMVQLGRLAGMSMTPHTTLAEARDWLRSRLRSGEGDQCPCCRQRVQIYRRTINNQMALALIEMYLMEKNGNITLGDFIHVRKDLRSKSHEVAQAEWWGLIESDGARQDAGQRSGRWRLTDRGRQYVRGRLTIPRYALRFDGKTIGFDQTEMVTIQDALGQTFDLNGLLGGHGS